MFRFLFELCLCILEALLTLIDWILILLEFVWNLITFPCSSHPSKKHVVVIGGSFAGLSCQRKLQKHFRVTLIDNKDYFEYTPGILRVFVELGALRKISAPQPRSRNAFIQGQVVNVTPQEIVVRHEDKTESSLSYDYLLVASGSSYKNPIKPEDTVHSFEERQSTWKHEYGKLKEASSVLIIGAGPVGVELATEIATEYPSKKITMVDMNRTVCASFPESTRAYITKRLVQMKVELVLGDAIAGKFPNLEIDERGCKLKSGRKIQADLVYQCTGFRPNTEFMRAAYKSSLHPRGALLVNDYLQLPAQPSIYAMGDAMLHEASDEIKLGHTADVNALLVVENVKRAEAKQPLLRYPAGVTGGPATPSIFCVSLGKYDATLGFNSLTLHGFLPAVLKWIIEWTQVMAARERPIGRLFWWVADKSSMFLNKYVLKPKKK